MGIFWPRECLSGRSSEGAERTCVAPSTTSRVERLRHCSFCSICHLSPWTWYMARYTSQMGPVGGCQWVLRSKLSPPLNPNAIESNRFISSRLSSPHCSQIASHPLAA